MSRTVYVTTELTGGGSALDGVNGNSLVKGDMAFLIQKDTTTPMREGSYFGVLMATTKSSTEESPERILPDSNPGDWNWERLQMLSSVFFTTGKAATLPNYGVQIIRSTAPTVHSMRRPRRGTFKTLVFTTTHLVKVRCSSAAASYNVKCGTSSVVIAHSSRALGGFHRVIQLVGRSTSRWDIISLSPTNKAFTVSTTTG